MEVENLKNGEIGIQENHENEAKLKIVEIHDN